MSAPHAIYQFALHHLLNLPHCRWLGLTVDQNTSPPIWCIPWRDDLVDQPDRGNIHSGALTTLIDMASTAAIMAKLDSFQNLATLDMRIDFLGLPQVQQNIYAQATCETINNQIAFVRSHCFQSDQTQPFALATATFMCSPLSASEQQTLQYFLQQEERAGHV
ncbi:PaaI family thioesterase [Neisseriaceae bacterium ESL0693]|nr:PaaI family thioesterase [Neisseriaceae bacterium ESL0693]